MSADSTQSDDLQQQALALFSQGKFQAAAQLCAQALEANPEHAGLLAVMGRAAQAQGMHAEAAAVLEKASVASPEDPDIFNDLGRSLNNLGQLQRAKEAFEQALRIADERVHEQSEDQADRQAEYYNNLGHVLRALGELQPAAENFTNAIGLRGDFAAAHNNLGTVYMLSGHPLAAAGAFARVCELEPGSANALANFALAMQTAGRLPAACEAYERALKLDPDAAHIWIALGLVHNEFRQTDKAELAFKEAIQLSPGDPRAYAELVALYEDVNRLESARSIAVVALNLAPDDSRLNLEFAKLDRRAGNPDAAIKRLQRFDLTSMDRRQAQMFAYELGLNKDRVGACEEAFGFFQLANDFAGRNERLQGVDASRFRSKVERSQAFFQRSEPRNWASEAIDDGNDTPAFLLGFPRSGTTITDLILDNHPEIATLEEKPTIEKLVISLLNREQGFPEVLETLSSTEIGKLRAQYFSEADQHVRRQSGSVLVDKMPIRTVNVGLIWRLFPDSKILFSLRHPCDVCLSCFMQQFNANDAFANFFTLADTVRVYDSVMKLWQLYVQKLPLNVLVVKYEDLVNDLEGESRRMLTFLDKPWQPEILDYRKRARERGRIATNSYHQVTEPLYTRAMGRWQHYAAQFEPFMPILRSHIRYFGYQED